MASRSNVFVDRLKLVVTEVIEFIGNLFSRGWR
jgi:hypothetical protein